MTHMVCIECGKRISSFDGEDDVDYWFCGELCAGSCCMWTYRGGLREPDEALKRLTMRHKEHGNPKDLERIEKILGKMTQADSPEWPGE